MQHITQGRNRYFYTKNIAIGHVIILVAIKIFKVGRHDATGGIFSRSAGH